MPEADAGRPSPSTALNLPPPEHGKALGDKPRDRAAVWGMQALSSGDRRPCPSTGTGSGTDTHTGTGTATGPSPRS
jgi:hypothetical protein